MLYTTHSTINAPPVKKRSLIKSDVEGPLCPSVLLEESCCSTTCPLSHTWSLYNAPTCVQFMSGFCPRGYTCLLGHSHAIALQGTWARCARFEVMGFCERGCECPKVHLWSMDEHLPQNTVRNRNGDSEVFHLASCTVKTEDKSAVKPGLIQTHERRSHRPHQEGRYWEHISSSDGEEDFNAGMTRRGPEKVAAIDQPIALGDYVPL